MPAELQEAWKRLHKDARPRQHSAEEARVALWVEQNGAQHGFRPPDVTERSRVMGAEAYLDALHLGTVQ
eukprot:10459592-Lingulodinium_polyedra.AAC.1